MLGLEDIRSYKHDMMDTPMDLPVGSKEDAFKEGHPVNVRRNIRGNPVPTSLTNPVRRVEPEPL